MPDITLSLISHTNVGKTTLMRTLLKRDVGEVSDHAHVTRENQRYALCETESGNHLYLWDTPGFGDTAQLLQRLREHEKPIKWLLLQTWDRLTNKPLYCNQQAVKNVQEDADVVLYLVNAAETPTEAGYVEMEMEVLAWIDRPVLVLLNQVGQRTNREQDRDDCDRWRQHLSKFANVHDVLSLDAFTRCWVQEGQVLSRVREMLPEEKRITYDELLNVWLTDHRRVFATSIDAVAAHLATAAAAHETVEKPSRRLIGRAVNRLTQQIERSQREMGDQLLSLHQLDGQAGEKVRTEMENYLRPKKKRSEWLSGAIAGAGSGLVGGIAADFLAGGLTFGGGAAAGFLLGFFAGSGLQGLFNLIDRDNQKGVACTPDFLDQLTAQAIIYYTAVAHYGRGRGAWQELATVDAWSEVAQAVVEDRRAELHRVWAASAAGPEEAREKLTEVAAALLRDTLTRHYPEAEAMLEQQA